MRPQMRRNPRAFTLIELLVSLSMIAMIFSASGICFARVTRLRGAHERYSNRLAKANYLLRSFARDVREAHGFTDALGQFESGEDCVVLRIGDGFVIYRVKGSVVERTQIGSGEMRVGSAMDDDIIRVQFDFESVAPEDARSVAVNVDWDEPTGIGLPHPSLSLRVTCRAHPRDAPTAMIPPTVDMEGM